MTAKKLSQLQPAEMRFFRRVRGETFRDKGRSCEIGKSLNVELILLGIDRSPVHWFGYVSRMSQERWSKNVTRLQKSDRYTGYTHRKAAQWLYKN